MKSKGKVFEEDFKKSCLLHNNISIDRLYDNTGGYLGVTNICDFILYRHPYQYYFELKSYQAKSFPLSGLSKTQYEGLLEKSHIAGVTAGVIINYRNINPKLNKTYFVDIRDVEKVVNAGEIKSISLKFAEFFGTPLLEKCKRTRWEYDIAQFLDSLNSNQELK